MSISEMNDLDVLKERVRAIYKLQPENFRLTFRSNVKNTQMTYHKFYGQ